MATNFELIKLFKKFDGRGRGSFSNNLRNNIKLEFFVIENVFGHELKKLIKLYEIYSMERKRIVLK